MVLYLLVIVINRFGGKIYLKNHYQGTIYSIGQLFWPSTEIILQD
jgi:hypothetical protein